MELPSWEVKGDEPSRASTGRLLLPLQPRQAASLLGSVGSHATAAFEPFFVPKMSILCDSV